MEKFLLVVLLSICSVVYGSVVANFDTFCDRGGLELILNCLKEGDTMYLTQKRLGQQGALWLMESVDIRNGFTTEFTFSIGNDGQSGDGMAFVLQGVGSSQVGNDGADIGYGSLPHALALEIDTHKNAIYNDPSDNHISFHLSPSHNGVAGGGGIRGMETSSPLSYKDMTNIVKLDDGQKHRVTVVYDTTSAQPTLSATVDGIAESRLEYGIHTNFPAAIGLRNGAAFMGFTASTGGAVESHKLHKWSIELHNATEGSCVNGFSGKTCDKVPTSSTCGPYKSCDLCTQSVACCGWCKSGCTTWTSGDGCITDTCPSSHHRSIVWWGIGIVVIVLCVCVVALFFYWRRTRTRSLSISDPSSSGHITSGADAQAQYSQL